MLYIWTQLVICCVWIQLLDLSVLQNLWSTWATQRTSDWALLFYIIKRKWFRVVWTLARFNFFNCSSSQWQPGQEPSQRYRLRSQAEKSCEQANPVVPPRQSFIDHHHPSSNSCRRFTSPTFPSLPLSGLQPLAISPLPFNMVRSFFLQQLHHQ